MENSGTSSFLRTRRLESCFNASSSLSVKETPKRSAKEELRSKRRADIYLDEDGWGSVLISWIRIVLCFLTMMVTTFLWASIMLVLIPWPYERIRQGNIYGHVTGRLMMWILGNPIKIEGAEFSNKRAIYISNHASPLDIFLIMWLTPTGTVGIAKKEGFIHLALQSRLPIIPMVLTGTHLAWRKGSLHIRPAPLNVKYLPPISTTDWTADKIEDYIKMIHDLYVKHLPESQRPLEL
ncbi:hypothetical protein I3760_12G125900 [Carya illinoinensis]|nr:hypothetical protein I3760_12G125900 [Carya illinoinensis]